MKVRVHSLIRTERVVVGKETKIRDASVLLYRRKENVRKIETQETTWAYIATMG